jgi:iron complex transport system substrate-binding protein
MSPSLRLLPLLASVLIVFSAGAALAESRTVVDAAGRTVTITDTTRIVSIGGAVTEILYALGVEDRVIAVDLTSTFPARVREKTSIGYMRTLSPEGVLSVDPGLVLAIEGSGPKEAIDVLEKASVPLVLVPEAHDGEGVLRKIRFVADAVGEHERGKALAAAVSDDLATLAYETARIGERRKAVFVLSMGGGAPMVAGDGTAAAAIFALAGVDNALGGFNGYKQASDEAAFASAPDAVVAMAEGHGTNAANVFALPAFAGTPAARDSRLIVMSGAYLLSFSPRAAHAAHDLAAGIYPDLALSALPPRPWTEDSATPP